MSDYTNKEVNIFYMNTIYPTNRTNQRQMISSETIAYWFLRLNGFMTTVNFVVHPERGREQRTDVDILGCRFPNRRELFENPMVDHEIFTRVTNKIFIAIAEVKRSTCGLNGPWTNPRGENMQRVLHAIGAFPESEVDGIANDLYRNGFFENPSTRISILCIGGQVNKEIKIAHPEVPQITWDQILSFIYSRFNSYRQQKSAHPQWDKYGKILWDLAMKSQSVDVFINRFFIL